MEGMCTEKMIRLQAFTTWSEGKLRYQNRSIKRRFPYALCMKTPFSDCMNLAEIKLKDFSMLKAVLTIQLFSVYL